MIQSKFLGMFIRFIRRAVKAEECQSYFVIFYIAHYSHTFKTVIYIHIYHSNLNFKVI